MTKLAGKLARTCYRILLKAGIAHDRCPSLKGMLEIERLKYYDHRSKAWVTVNASQAAPEAQALIYYLSALTGGGIFYVSLCPRFSLSSFSLLKGAWSSAQVPEASCANLIRTVFRTGLVTPAAEGPSFLAKVDRLDVATACIRIFEENLAKVCNDEEAFIFWLCISRGLTLFFRKAKQLGIMDMKAVPATRTFQLERCGTIGVGSLLLAHPRLAQPTLTRSIILITQVRPWSY